MFKGEKSRESEEEEVGRWLMKGLLWRRNYTLSSRWLVWEDEAQGREDRKEPRRNYLRKSKALVFF